MVPSRICQALAMVIALSCELLLFGAATPVWAQASTFSDDRYISLNYSRRAPPPRRPTDTPRRRDVEATRPPQNRGEYIIPPSLYALVMGDSFAEWLAYGLDEAFEDVPEFGILDRTQLLSGLMQKEPINWPQLVRDNLAKDPKADFIVFTAGYHDRDPLKVDAELLDIRSPRWIEMYQQRLTETMEALKAPGKPVFWISIPPVRGPRSADIAHINRLIRDKAEAMGITYLDIWNAFSDEQGNFVPVGPDFAGQNRRLRTSDGINFTPAGARKYAFYVEQPLRQLLAGRIGGGGIAAPGEVPALMPELGIAVPQAAPMVMPDFSSTVIRPRAEAGPVISLTGAASGFSQASGGLFNAQGNQPKRATLAPELSLGEPLNAPPGRADDFRWLGSRASR